MADSIFSYSKNLINLGFLSLDIYHMRPHTVEGKHYHKGIELVYVAKGDCKTHKQGRLYLYKPHQVHEEINDSNGKMVFICLTIPKESDDNTVYL